ncbi:hypothetical protein FW778_22825 [Ginsengibacter hankyongi]|uniref:Uncharacterized protein n=1 Tax=Ginsengibacter hankyongi TaxID=2607284 RepID=A0A5J5IBD5_9BACT|nr:hypothetical protein [Ginsengibacter hankyongi]KAA9034350.1 hypothetical protein FW778_22825 [Ginsengibacter hankyongi]
MKIGKARFFKKQNVICCSHVMMLTMFFIFNANAQKHNIYTKDSLSLCAVKKITIKLDTIQMSSSTAHVRFGHIRVVDVRFDTTMVDYFSSIHNGFTVNAENYKVTLQGSLGSSLTQVLNHFYKNNLRDTEDGVLIVFLKKLSVSKADSTYQLKLHNYRKINFVAEMFLNKGGNDYAACKVDTVILTEIYRATVKKYSRHIEDSLIMPAIAALERTIDNTDWSVVLNRKAFEPEFVLKHYCRDMFNLPILNELCNKGVYKTYKEFLLNKPSIRVFTIKEKNTGVNILQDEAGNILPMVHYFGYCDGKNCWIMTDVRASPLFRVGNSFEFFGHFNYNFKDEINNGASLFTTSSNLSFLESLDLETKN